MKLWDGMLDYAAREGWSTDEITLVFKENHSSCSEVWTKGRPIWVVCQMCDSVYDRRCRIVGERSTAVRCSYCGSCAMKEFHNPGLSKSVRPVATEETWRDRPSLL